MFSCHFVVGSMKFRLILNVTDEVILFILQLICHMLLESEDRAEDKILISE